MTAKKEKPAVLPCNLEVSKDDQQIAKDILTNVDNYIVRYLRKDPTVGLAKLPIRNEDGAVLQDVPWRNQRVICSGIPYACMIAFMHGDKLLIGWSKRIEDKKVIETQDLHKIFQSVLEATEGVMEDSDNYRSSFDAFCQNLLDVLSLNPAKEIEKSFSKKDGKMAAVLRGLKDTLEIKGNFIVSAASGPVPNEIAKRLPDFIAYVERVYEGKAANVAYADKAIAEKPATAMAVV